MKEVKSWLLGLIGAALTALVGLLWNVNSEQKILSYKVDTLIEQVRKIDNTQAMGNKYIINEIDSLKSK
jgi:hypothetical protein